MLRNLLAVTLTLTSAFCLPARAQHPLAAVLADPPADKVHPAAMEPLQLPSHGANLNAFAYIAAGAEPHPVVILLHGFPGYERNLDLAQAIRRSGWDVLYLDYRGSWGSPGDFSFTHSLEDVQSAVAYLQTPANAARLHADPRHIVLVGHSMGGFMALQGTAANPAVEAVASISAADLSGFILDIVHAGQREKALAIGAQILEQEGMAPLAGCTPRGLATEVVDHADAWSLPTLAPKLAARPVLAVTSDDGMAAGTDSLVANLHQAGAAHVTAVHLATDHSYSDHRIALETAVLHWLQTLPR